MKMFAAETARPAHAVIYLPIPSAAPFYGIDAAKSKPPVNWWFAQTLKG